ncbi:hypothetical protein B0J18DRAFT_419913 [Chaetomium sp. MPI-SDFR-AT-0129]|nr:hypothetical protein B0J18DRAFT_419913 [Chaetomium sp. MPI-SDFR-AT-0129]
MAPGQAYTGGPPGHVPLDNAFSFAFSQPLQAANDYTPRELVLPRIEDERPIFIDNKTDRTLRFGQIGKDARAVAAGLLRLGLDPNDTVKLPPTASCPAGPEIAPVVLIQLPNCLPYAPILFGVLASGLTATLVSPALTSDEIAWILQNARPRAIITATACLPAMQGAIAKQADAARTFFSTVPLFTVDAAGDPYPQPASPTPLPSDWRALLAPEPNPKSTVNLSPGFPASRAASRTAVILWSSGTSGRSKGVLLSHHALNFTIASMWHDADFYLARPQRQVWLGYVPFYHVFGLCNVFLLAVATGTAVYTMPSFHLETVLQAVRDRGVTYFHMAPPVAVMLAKAAVVEPYARSGGFKTVTAGVTGGAPLGYEVIEEVYKRCGFRVRMGYGLSETCATALQGGCGEKEMRAHAGDTGVPHWGVELLIAANSGEGVYATKPGEKTKAAAWDEEGEVLIRAPGLLLAYLPIGVFSFSSSSSSSSSSKQQQQQPDMSVTQEALTADGWFRTGDVGALSPAGRLRITDRLKELIKVRAYQVAPAELEAVLCSSEAVADAGVIGIYDKSEATEYPRAFVVPRAAGTVTGGVAKMSRAELEGLAQQLKVLVETRTAKYKWLVGGIVFVDQIPKSPSGKILRRLLKDGGEVARGVEFKVYTKKRRDAKL